MWSTISSHMVAKGANDNILVLNLSVERRCLDKKQSKCFTFFLSVLG